MSGSASDKSADREAYPQGLLFGTRGRFSGGLSGLGQSLVRQLAAALAAQSEFMFTSSLLKECLYAQARILAQSLMTLLVHSFACFKENKWNDLF